MNNSIKSDTKLRVDFGKNTLRSEVELLQNSSGTWVTEMRMFGFI